LSENKRYDSAMEEYAELGIDTNKVIDKILKIPLSIHCWQGDDIRGFEPGKINLDGAGILSTGNYPGKPRNIDEFRSDIEKAFSMVPGKKKLALHAIYGNFNGKLEDRSTIAPEHFKYWVDWSKKYGYGIDFNPSMFAHPMSSSGYTLSSLDKTTRQFWIDHVKNSRKVCNYIGDELKEVCVNNLWIADGSKDLTVNRLRHREILVEALDEIFSIKYPEKNVIDSLESKLFGIGVESFTVGSHELYLGYAVKNGLGMTLDTGHFHPTEIISDKISSVLLVTKFINLHITRGVRWDSDHIPILTEELISIMQEIIRAKALDKVYIGTDFFDSSMNRIGAWVIGSRAVLKALLIAMLEPTELIAEYENSGNMFAKLALLENLKSMPFGDIWDHYCEMQSILKDKYFIGEVLKYEKDTLAKRN
jgi:L-rhamnose isomerase